MLEKNGLSVRAMRNCCHEIFNPLVISRFASLHEIGLLETSPDGGRLPVDRGGSILGLRYKLLTVSDAWGRVQALGLDGLDGQWGDL